MAACATADERYAVGGAKRWVPAWPARPPVTGCAVNVEYVENEPVVHVACREPIRAVSM